MGRRRYADKPRRESCAGGLSGMLAGLAAGIVVAAGLVAAPGPARAVECANAGAAPLVDADDSGDPTNTACGDSSVTSGSLGSSLSTAYGHRSMATGDFSTAVGALAVAPGSGSSAFGFSAVAGGDMGSAFGSGATANGVSSSAFGRLSTARGDSSVAIGERATVNAGSTNSVAVGAFNAVTGQNSGAFGTGNTVNGNGSFAIGDPNVINGNNSFAFGDDNTINGDNSIAIGNGNTVNHDNAAAFGNGVVTTRDNQQAFGAANNTYTFAGITSQASRAAQSGPVEIVTSDAGGNLATATAADLGLASIGDVNALNTRIDRNSRRIEMNTEGVAMALALAGSFYLPDGKDFAIGGSYGVFEGGNALGFGATGRISRNAYVSAGVGLGLNEGTVGGRAGVLFAW